MAGRAALLIAAALAGLSLLVHRTADFDPTAWLIWGRQLGRGELWTINGPSWKPLPVLFTTPFSWFGAAAAEAMWVFVARLAGLVSVLLAYRVTVRLGGGRAGGVLAAAGLALATGFLYNAARGDAEGLLVLCGLLAVDQWLSGRPRAALALGALAGLIRPEVWPLLAVFGGWVAWRDRRVATLLFVSAVGALLLAAWLLPEHAGSDEWWRAASRATHPAPGTPGDSAFPFGMTFVSGARALPWPLYAGAVFAVVAAWRARDRVVLALAGGAAFHMLLVAAMAEAGFTGNLRYLTLPAAVLCVLGGLGLPRLWVALRGPAWRVAGGVLAVGAVAYSLALWAGDVEDLALEQRVYDRELSELIELAGGRAAVLACGAVGANHFGQQALAYKLDLRQQDIRLGTDVPGSGTVFARLGTGAAEAPHPPVVREHGSWLLKSTCSVRR